jgi:predicted aminopeptidase
MRLRGLLITCCLLLGGCAELGYYAHTIGGQLDVLSRRQPIDDLIAADETDPALKQQLQQVKSMRRFAVEQLSLPDSGSYSDFVELDRSHVLWNVFATPEFSLTAKQWCYPFFGCVSYRTFFDRDMAQRYADELEAEGYDASVGAVATYSTLGWFDDPLYSTMLRYSEAELAGFIFHELAHERLYIRDDTEFNESFAMSVQLEGMQRWLVYRQQAGSFNEYYRDIQRDEEFVVLIMRTRQRLQQLYASSIPAAQMREQKSRLFLQLREEFADLRRQWHGYDAYDSWFQRRLNNAALAPIGTYHGLVPYFRALLEHNDGHLSDFMQQVEEIGQLPLPQRHERIKQFMPVR